MTKLTFSNLVRRPWSETTYLCIQVSLLLHRTCHKILRDVWLNIRSTGSEGRLCHHLVWMNLINHSRRPWNCLVCWHCLALNLATCRGHRSQVNEVFEFMKSHLNCAIIHVLTLGSGSQSFLLNNLIRRSGFVWMDNLCT